MQRHSQTLKAGNSCCVARISISNRDDELVVAVCSLDKVERISNATAAAGWTYHQGKSRTLGGCVCIAVDLPSEQRAGGWAQSTVTKKRARVPLFGQARGRVLATCAVGREKD